MNRRRAAVENARGIGEATSRRDGGMERWTNVVVGAGISGASMARLLAERLGERVLVIEGRNHVAGNCHDYFDHNGICIHRYGAHIFHTNDDEVWDFLGAFTRWRPFRHRVKAFLGDGAVPLPFNLESLRLTFPDDRAKEIEDALLTEYGLGSTVALRELRRSAVPALRQLAEFVEGKIYAPYALKQWGIPHAELPASVADRVPVRVGFDDGYFTDKYEGIPAAGYTAMIEAMLAHPLIEVRLNTRYENSGKAIAFDRLFHTGSIDEYFGYSLGVLPYRSVRLEMTEVDKPFFQECAVVNYPEAPGFTRIIEFKHFLGNDSPRTVIAREYPYAHAADRDERFYPMENAANAALHRKYQEQAKSSENVWFFGRLGDYKYYNMDAAAKRAMELFDEACG